MPRELTPAVAAASTAAVIRPILLLRLAYASGDVLVASTPFAIQWDWNGDGVAEDFLGVGALGAISPVEEGTEVQPYSLAITLSAIPQEYIALALDAGKKSRGRDVRLWLALLDDQHRVIDTPYLLFRGRMDTQDLELGSEGKITVTAHSRLRDWERPRIRRYTDEDQRAEYPGDLGLQFVAQMAEKELLWGRTAAS